MGVLDGTPVDAANTNPAFLDANNDDVALGVIGFNDSGATATSSGTAVTNIQREQNALWSFIGGLINQVKTYVPTWTSNNFGSAAMTVKAKIEAIDAGFSTAGTQAARAGRVSLGSGIASKAVTFGSSMTDNDYVLTYTIENLTDSNPMTLSPQTTARSATGFTVSFTGPTDTANYVLHYSVRKAA